MSSQKQIQWNFVVIEQKDLQIDIKYYLTTLIGTLLDSLIMMQCLYQTVKDEDELDKKFKQVRKYLTKQLDKMLSNRYNTVSQIILKKDANCI